MSLLLTLLLATTPDPSGLTVGLYLPASIGTGVRFSEGLAHQLGERLHRPVVARSFSRWEDLSRAVQAKQVDLYITESWTPLKPDADVVAQALIAHEPSQRWVVLSTALSGKRLAVLKALEPAFVSHAIFGGDLPRLRFQLISAQTVEAALNMLESSTADAALVPQTRAPPGAPVVYRSPGLPSPLVVNVTTDADELRAAFAALGPSDPFTGFTPVARNASPLSALRRLIAQGPPRPRPSMVEPPTFHLDPAQVSPKGPALAFPNFTRYMKTSAELPDD